MLEINYFKSSNIHVILTSASWPPQQSDQQRQFAALLQFGVNSVLELSLRAVPPASVASPAESPGKTEANAFRDCAVRQHGLLSASAAAGASSYLSEAAGATARLWALPAELYILAGHFAAGDEREYKYGRDITLSLAPRCGWDERYRTNCSGGDCCFCQLGAATGVLTGTTARVGNLGMCKTSLMEIYAELISAWWKGSQRAPGIDFKISVAIIFAA